MGKNTRVLVMVQAAIFAAVAMVLSMLPTTIGTSLTISLGMVPLTITSLRAGTKAGLLAGLIWGLLHFVTGNVMILGALQAFIEYIIAFVFAGFAGLIADKFHSSSKRKPLYLILSVLIGTFARFFWHFIAGVVYWGEYAPEGWSPLYFSFVMNGASALLTAIISALVLVIIYAVAPIIFKEDTIKPSNI
ncbi:energy-coupled thiamine transporter ThiT [Facklamia sp. DSM 111018]|uniref:Energy-coupled thiamine transporter ThiT n=1 Tax=Facklamia lactis TaxID=2749967 RepID=A0ABS0LSN9_9LACT|nr:energy-coupled thiamine transporter ThiT [Facklamia lactis]MBG9981338.1 energy-coupled thiamine transporter ThiT [Facklamia lactis]MBG9987186.1 energy-coupled thiamine transporter ThiT [Facklamia lactis]